MTSAVFLSTRILDPEIATILDYTPSFELRQAAAKDHDTTTLSKSAASTASSAAATIPSRSPSRPSQGPRVDSGLSLLPNAGRDAGQRAPSPSQQQPRTRPDHYTPLRTSAAEAGKVDSQPRTVASVVKSRTHSRIASLGRIRSRGGTQPPSPQVLVPYGDYSSDVQSTGAARLHKRSDTSTLSNLSTESASSDDSKSEKKDPEELDEPRSEQPERLASRQRARMMHQTSSKLLRMTEDERPFTRDFMDLFSTLMVSLPLTPHRVRFSRVEHTFTADEAITNLGSLKFSQSNRMPDPKDPTRIVTTTTTTTFSMAKEMARSVCQRFLDARFVESVDGKTDFGSRSSVWQLSPKGMQVLSTFCQRNGIHQRHVNELLDSPRNMMQLVTLERQTETDKLNDDQATVNVIFRRFAGDAGPNVKSSSAPYEGDAVNEYATGLVGVRVQRARGTDKDLPCVFSGKAAFDWLMDCCTVVDRREVFEIANLFLRHGLISAAPDERYGTPPIERAKFIASKQVLYSVTQTGMRVAGWVTSPNGTVNGEATIAQRIPAGVTRDSNTNRMTAIVRDPALRLLFREYLRDTHCEENLAFYVEVQMFISEYERAKRSSSPPKIDIVRETLASAYSLYNAFLAPGSPCELNIDHNLRSLLASRMTRAVGEDDQIMTSLEEVASLFDQAQTSVFKLMASDSVPKFFREPKYAAICRERNLDTMLGATSSTATSTSNSS